MIYRFRIILDHHGESDIFRDIELRNTDMFEDFHNAIVQAFGFDGTEMASFYVSDDLWEQGEEISLFDLGEGESASRNMATIQIQDLVDGNQNKLIYIYDFLNMWTFLVELSEILNETDGSDYPKLLFAHGQMPESAPEKEFETEGSLGLNGFEEEEDEEGYDEEDYDRYDSSNDWY